MLCLQVGQALRYAKAIWGQPDDPSLAMKQDEGLGGWTPLLLIQSVYALWDGILESPAPPATARGPCPAQGYEYAVAVYHYTRSLALAARCAAALDTLACSQAQQELQHLQVCLHPLLQGSVNGAPMRIGQQVFCQLPTIHPADIG